LIDGSLRGAVVVGAKERVDGEAGNALDDVDEEVPAYV
jgi:hypothetical protein